MTVRELLPPIPTDASGWSDVLRATREAGVRVPPSAVERIVQRQRALGAGARAESNAQALGRSNTVAVVTGQQPGLLGGLLLAHHKAAGVVHLAGRLDGHDGGRVVPVFWVASEDHDLDEANRLFLLDRQGQSRRLALPLEADGRSLMHREVTPDVAEAFLREVATHLPDTERAREALALVRHPEGADLGTWGTASMARLLGDTGLVFLDPRDLLPDAGDALASLVLEAEPIGSALRAAEARLHAAELPAPLSVGDDYVALFVRTEPDGPRRRIARDAHGTIRTKDGEALGSADEVAARIRARPDLASGDVVGRVFVQDLMLPVLAYLGGPTELAYHVQVRAAHEAVGLRYPLALARPAATWADAKAERTAAAFGTSVEALSAPGGFPDRPPGTTKDTDAALEAAFEAWRSALEPPAALVAWATQGGERRAALDRARERTADACRRAEQGLRAVSERERGAGAARWARLQALLRPRGRPQERALGALSLVARYGVEAFRAGLADLDALAPAHRVVHVG